MKFVVEEMWFIIKKLSTLFFILLKWVLIVPSETLNWSAISFLKKPLFNAVKTNISLFVRWHLYNDCWILFKIVFAFCWSDGW